MKVLNININTIKKATTEYSMVRTVSSSQSPCLPINYEYCSSSNNCFLFVPEVTYEYNYNYTGIPNTRVRTIRYVFIITLLFQLKSWEVFHLAASWTSRVVIGVSPLPPRRHGMYMPLILKYCTISSTAHANDDILTYCCTPLSTKEWRMNTGRSAPTVVAVFLISATALPTQLLATFLLKHVVSELLLYLTVSHSAV